MEAAELTDGQVVGQEIRLGELADELGFHAWPVEHHFDDYWFCRSNSCPRAHGSPRTKRILLDHGSGDPS